MLHGVLVTTGPALACALVVAAIYCEFGQSWVLGVLDNQPEQVSPVNTLAFSLVAVAGNMGRPWVENVIAQIDRQQPIE